ncbi:L-dopachrome tautomerase-related protein [Chryseobacterium arthrosphaerae]|uniref:L-dopachrome tautomerase-related protein n=1 Tax=Chryseobacterium arthrosphaerae TaxID=651561 RepID=UPI0023E0BA8D|nr:L-dopachrome tautomerase-related protein [Chryseobacterium arthrosphaerae]WES99496.1 L-dopachrome tautomerase-related protein [Chryseobacterium arthrosphaerae]
MNLKNTAVLAMVLVSLTACNKSPNQANSKSGNEISTEKNVQLEEIFSDSTYQLTGVAVAKDNRVFVNYPYWLDTHSYSVVEVKDGKPLPYPDAEWNSFKKGEDGQNKFVTVQSVVTDDKGFLWVVDAAGIGLGKVYQHSSKVVKINLANNKIEKIYRFPENVVSEEVYINDIRVDNENGFAYLSNSNTGGIVVLNINTGDSRLVLANSPSVKSDPNYHFSPLGTELKKGDGSLLKVNSDGIALAPDNQYLYYKPLTDNRLYRIKTDLLRDFKTNEAVLNKNVEDLGKFITTDGMIFDKKGNLYLGDLEKNSIVKITPDLKMQTIVKDDEKLIWPDSYSISDDGYLYISNSQIQLMPWFHKGKEQFKKPFKVFKIKI